MPHIRFSLLATAFFLIVFLGGCQNAPSFTSEAPPSPQHSFEKPGMALHPGDSLMITVLGDEDVSGAYEVSPQGFITMPLIGDVQAQGLTPAGLQSSLAAKLSEGFLVDPQVSVEMTSLRPFYILGEVKNPGSYPAAADMDVFKAIASAGGLTPRAVDGSYLIYRGVGAGRMEIAAGDETLVFPGDSIKVKERFF